MATVKSSQNQGTLLITVSRPESMNALSNEVFIELDKLLKDALANPEIRGIIITGEGEKAFVAGADIKELSSLNKEDAQRLSERGQNLFARIENSPKPIESLWSLR
jgi:enoyl-CoA hydratase